MSRHPWLLALMLATACDGTPQAANDITVETIDVPQTVSAMAPGTTPMAGRVAVLRLLNKRNGLWRDITLRPGQAVRFSDLILRLRACETPAPWEVQRLTGAFVQLDVRNVQGRYQRVFSGWLYKESPSLNVVEHAVYDVSPISCAMTHPAGGSPVAREPSSRSSAPRSAAPAEVEESEEVPAAPKEAPPEEAPSAEANEAR